jgi:hypothetical protein
MHPGTWTLLAAGCATAIGCAQSDSGMGPPPAPKPPPGTRVGYYVEAPPYGTINLSGQPGTPIVFRGYPGERATINGSLAAQGSDLTFWGFEIMQTTPLNIVDRVLEANTVNGRFLNLVLHDAGFSGVSMAAGRYLEHRSDRCALRDTQRPEYFRGGGCFG